MKVKINNKLFSVSLASMSFSIMSLLSFSLSNAATTTSILNLNATPTVSTTSTATNTNFINLSTSTTATVTKVLITACEYFDDAALSVLTLDQASTNAKQKLEIISDTIDSEVLVRDGILNSVKNFLGLQEKEKAIFSDMKKEIYEAKEYYFTVDEKVDISGKFLEKTNCEKTKIKPLKFLSKDLRVAVEDEISFRKQFTSTLKSKMKVIQDEVKKTKK